MASKMTFQFLDVGMGDGTLVQLRPEGQEYDTLVLVDFGEEKSPFAVALQDALTYLRTTIAANSKARNLDAPYVDKLFVTHSDADHHNRLTELFKPLFPGYDNKELRFGEVRYSGESDEYDGLIENLESRSTLVQDFQDKYHAEILIDDTVKPDFQFGDINAYVLSVNYPSITGKTNPKSIVLLFELGTQKVILQGDAEKATESWILDNFGEIDGFLEVVGHKLGHHGSQNATTPLWVAALKPKAIFASGDFFWAHPYCKPICRVLDGGTLAPPPGRDLWYCCGNRGEYFNNHHSLSVCMNLWYYVKSQGGENVIVLPSEKVAWTKTGVTFGVQWALRLTAGAQPVLMRTEDIVIPYDVLGIPPGFNCPTGTAALSWGDDEARAAQDGGEGFFGFETVPVVTL